MSTTVIPWNDLKNFDKEIYRLNYPELIPTQQDAIVHYAHVGHLENRTDQVPTLFDWEKYANTYRHLCLSTPRDAYLHFARLGLKYKQEKTKKPIAMLFLSQYEKIMEYNQSRVWLSGINFHFPPPPKNMTTPSQYRQPNTPDLLTPPKEPLKTPRSTDPVSIYLHPKIAVITYPVRQKIQTSTSSHSILQPTQKTTTLHKPSWSDATITRKITTLSILPPPKNKRWSSSQSPVQLQPLHKPSRSGVIHTSTQKRPPLPNFMPPHQETTERRMSQPPVQLQPLHKPSRSGIIHTSTPKRPTLSAQPHQELTEKRLSQPPIQLQPLSKPSQYNIIQKKISILPEKPPAQLHYKSAYQNKSSMVRQPKEGELLLKVPPSQYFKYVLGPPKFLN